MVLYGLKKQSWRLASHHKKIMADKPQAYIANEFTNQNGEPTRKQVFYKRRNPFNHRKNKFAVDHTANLPEILENQKTIQTN